MSDRASLGTVLLTGASRGLGRQLALRLAGRAERLALVARDAEAAGELAAHIRAAGDTRAEAFAHDLAAPDGAGLCAAAVHEAFGDVDVLINNAGVGHWRPFLEHGPAEHDRIIDVNFRAVVHLTQAVLPAMVARGRGHVVNIASDLATRPLGNMAVYAATKFALRGFSLSLSQEVRPRGVRVTLVNPGLIDTAFGGRVEGSLDARGALQPDELARLVVEMIEQPGHQLVDEVTVHALGQDY